MRLIATRCLKMFGEMKMGWILMFLQAVSVVGIVVKIMLRLIVQVNISKDQATGGGSSEGDVSDSGDAIGEEEKDSNDGSDMDGAMEGHGDVGPGPSRKHQHVRGRDPHRKREHLHRSQGPTHGRRDTPLGDKTPC